MTGNDIVEHKQFRIEREHNSMMLPFWVHKYIYTNIKTTGGGAGAGANTQRSPLRCNASIDTYAEFITPTSVPRVDVDDSLLSGVAMVLSGLCSFYRCVAGGEGGVGGRKKLGTALLLVFVEEIIVRRR